MDMMVERKTNFPFESAGPLDHTFVLQIGLAEHNTDMSSATSTPESLPVSLTLVTVCFYDHQDDRFFLVLTPDPACQCRTGQNP